MSISKQLIHRILSLTAGLCLAVSLWAQADLSSREFSKYMTALRREAERQNLLSNYPRMGAILAEADSLMTARRGLGLEVVGKIEANFLKLRGDYYYWLALGESEKGTAYKADSCYRASLMLYRTRFLPFPDTVVQLNQLGQLHYAEGDYPTALAYLQSAARTNTVYAQPRDRHIARAGAAMCQARMGLYDAALQTLDSCSDTKEIWRMRAKILCLSMEARAAERSIVLPQADTLYRRFVEALRIEADSVFRELEPDERERWWVSIRPFITDCWRLEDQDAGLLYDVALLSKSILLQLCRDMNTDDTLSRTRALHVRWQDIQQALGERELAFEWLEYERDGIRRLGAVGLKKTGKPFFLPLCPIDSLRLLRLSNRQTVEQAIASSLPQNKNFLYNDPNLQYIFRSFFAAGRGARNIYFSPDGILHLLGIEYLSGSEKLSLHRVTSTRQLLYSRPMKDTRALIIGGIDYNAPLDTANRPPMGDSLALRYLAQRHVLIRPLAHTLVESREVYAIRNHPDDRLLLAGDATEDAFRRLSGGVGLIHLSTHGFFYGELQSVNPDLPSPQQTDAALSQSGLLFAGINSSLSHPLAACAGNDGLLSAREISTLHLDSVGLFVVCACQGGMGRVTPDGVFGVQRGLKSAGVQAMVVSLWKVDDQATALFMTALHRRINEGAANLREAFRMARRDLIYFSPKGASAEEFDPEDDELFPYALPYFSNAFILIEG